ncbi:putative G-protein coupled receptor 150 [Lampetra fluviatilis]
MELNSSQLWERNGSGDGFDVARTDTAQAVTYDRSSRIATLATIFTLSVLGNACVLAKIACGAARGRRRARRVDVLFSNLAAADLCVALLTLLSQMVWEALEDAWLGGDASCRVLKVAQIFGLMASSNMIVVIALERHRVILYPLEPPLPARRLCLSAWLCALLLSAPQALVFRAVHPDPAQFSLSLSSPSSSPPPSPSPAASGRCVSTFSELPRWHFQAYIIYGATAVFIVPFCVLCVAYTRILYTVWSKERYASPARAVPGTPADSRRRPSNGGRAAKGPAAAAGPLRVKPANSALPRAKVKTLKMTLVIILLFIVCGLPYFVLEMKFAFGSASRADEQVTAVLGIFVASNCAVDPFVYLFFSSDNRYVRYLETSLCFACLHARGRGRRGGAAGLGGGSAALADGRRQSRQQGHADGRAGLRRDRQRDRLRCASRQPGAAAAGWTLGPALWGWGGGAAYSEAERGAPAGRWSRGRRGEPSSSSSELESAAWYGTSFSLGHSEGRSASDYSVCESSF